jgi:hypothetical protein
MSVQIDKEKTRKNIDLILEKIRTDADPLVLNEYRALFKRNISLFRRPWASAYLLMLFDQGGLGRTGRGRKNGNGRSASGGNDTGSGANSGAAGSGAAGSGAAGSGAGGETQRFPLAEEESKRLFISVGRNRRVFPREILGLINAKTSIPRDDIGSIRILDNYSFVQVRDTVAEQIIKALNGCTFRGRTLTVNYAKSRKDGAPAGTEDREDSESFEEDLPDAALEQDEDHSDKEDI